MVTALQFGGKPIPNKYIAKFAVKPWIRRSEESEPVNYLASAGETDSIHPVT
jgi:hypothetical protein